MHFSLKDFNKDKILLNSKEIARESSEKKKK